MNPISIIDLISFIAAFISILIILFRWKSVIDESIKIIFGSLLILTLFLNFSNVLEWSGFTNALDVFEDYIEIMQPFFWVFFFYVFIQEVTKKQLRVSEEKFRGLVESSSDFIWEVDKEDIYSYVSPQVYAILGYKPEEIIDKTPFDLMLPKEAARAAKTLKRAFEKGDPIIALENICLHKDGRHVVLETSSVPVFDKAGKVIGYRGIDRDITERKRAEKYLEENTKKLNLMIDRSPVGVSTTNQKGEFLSVNPSFCEMLGYSADELLKKTFSDITHPEDKDENRLLFKDLVQQKIHSYDLEKRYIKKNGEIIYVFLRSQLVTDESGKPIFELAICEDITQQMKAKKELLRSEMRMKAIFQDALDVIAIIDFENGNILDINNAVESILGYKKEMLIGNPFFTLFSPETDKSRKQLFEDLKTRDAVFESQEFMRKDGSICLMDLSIIKIPWGENEAVLANLRDVTERNIAEKRTQKDLKEKEVMLMEIHHRVKNNLQIISSMLKMQSAYIKDEEALEYFKDSQNRVKTMSLIHESLYQSEDLSKINLNRYIKKLINQLIISFRNENKNIKLIMNIDEIFFNINKTIPLGLLINEIVSNSFKYAFPHRKDGEIKISLKKKGAIHTLVIADNGLSMPEDLDIENTNTFGLHLLNALISQLNGKLTLNRKNGTSYKIKFDLEPEQ